MNKKNYNVGVDIGGTFTDLILINETDGSIYVGKTLTTPEDPSIAVITALKEAVKETGIFMEEIRNIIHGTTLAVNAIVERKGAKTGMMTTKGFRDVVEIGRERRYDMDDIFIEMRKPIVPRFLRVELDERILSDGSIQMSLNDQDVIKTLNFFIKNNIEAIAVCLIHAYKNPQHEKMAMGIIQKYAPEIYCSISSEIVSQIREYERFSTTSVNAYVQPLIDKYLSKLEGDSKILSFKGTIFIMMSSGGICTIDTAKRYPVTLIESGPAAGVLAASYYGELIGCKDLISYDMGGTTAKIAIIDKGEPMRTYDYEVDRIQSKRGSGLPIKIWAIDMIDIGSGGGSIAKIDRMGLLRVGPESAGSSPGPVCYGLGGTEPTVTDADLVLGYLDPDYFLGGRMKLDSEVTTIAIKEKIADPLNIDITQAAWGIHQIVNEEMANATNLYAAEKGQNPRLYPLFAFGGAGPVHACRVGKLLHSPMVIVPYGAGTTSALGMLYAPLSFNFVRSYYSDLQNVDWSVVNKIYRDMEEEGKKLLISAGVPKEQIRYIRSCDMRYIGQGHEINASIPLDVLGEGSYREILSNFEATYTRHFNRLCPDMGIEALNWRLSASGPRPELRIYTGITEKYKLKDALKGERKVYFPESGGYVSTPVYDRYRLSPEMKFSGPAIIEERESTTVIIPNSEVSIDYYNNIIVRWK